MSEITRAPIVTILGHVDHGKTTLLDFIRKSSVASKEHGGITQHIGAYQVIHNSQLITFIDTPGHAAFEQMRSRGASVADIAVLVVSIDDGLMPQTLEAIKHIKGQSLPAGRQVPMIVAVNKIDLPGIDKNIQLQRIKKQLSDKEVLIEEYGGDVPIVEISAKTGLGVDKLLEVILLVAEMNELKGDPNLDPSGVVIESSMDKFKGPVATILVRNGTLKKGIQIMVTGVKGKIKGMLDSSGSPVESAGPSMPVEVLGLEGVPPVGATLGEEGKAAEAAKTQVENMINRLKQGDSKTLKIIIKADKQGSLEAIQTSLDKFNLEKGLPAGRQVIDFIFTGTGEINEENIKLAGGVGAIVVGFNVKVNSNAQKLAEADHVLIRSYNIIYELLDEVEEVLNTLLEVGQLEEVFGRAEIIAEFEHGKKEKIAGCRMVEGIIAKGQRIRVVRGKELIGETKLKSLKKVKDEVNKVEKGNDCGMYFEPQIDFLVGDVVESFRTI